MNRSITLPSSPYHPLSSLVTIVLDNLLSGPEDIIMPFSIPVTMALAFTTCTISVTLTQHYLAHDPWGESLAKGFAAGVMAGVPFPVAGTAAGALMLGWSGLNKLLPAPSSNNNP
jgi:hypothetical protein